MSHLLLWNNAHITEMCTGEIWRLLALRWSRSVPFSKDSVMPHNLEDDPGSCSTDSAMGTILEGCDSGGAPSGVPPFPPPPPPKKKKKGKKRTKKKTPPKKKERGGGLDAPFVWLSPGWHSTAIVLIPLGVFAHACELHPVSYVSFPCTREKMNKREMRIYTSGAACG